MADETRHLPEVYLEGAGLRRTPLSRESQGPRAVWNALERLVAGYGSRSDELRRDLALAEGKLRDFEARLGATFPHESSIDELSTLRDELRVALSVTQPPPEAAAEQPKTRTTAELSERINERIHALKRGHTADAVPAKKRVEDAALQPVTARIRRRTEVCEETPPPAAESEAPREDAVAVGTPEGPGPVPAPRLAARGRPEGRRRNYQKWLF